MDKKIIENAAIACDNVAKAINGITRMLSTFNVGVAKYKEPL